MRGDAPRRVSAASQRPASSRLPSSMRRTAGACPTPGEVMLELYIANKNYSSWSLRPWLLMVERDIAFQEHLVALQDGSSWAAFRVFSPNGKVPCLRDGDSVVWDSLAIAEYLAERHPGVWPAEPKARAWARSASAEMHSGFTALCCFCLLFCV